MTTPNINIPITLVGSNFHDSFVDSLKTKKWAFTTVSTFAEHKAPLDEHQTRVIVLHGHDDALLKPTTLTTLLDQSTVLVFFAPSKELLDALQAATKCLLHIPSIELEGGTPLIMHRHPLDGVLSVTPGFGVSTESTIHYVQADAVSGEATPDSNLPSLSTPPPVIPSPEEKLVMNFARSVKMIQRTVEYRLELLHEDKPTAEQNLLTPDPGTQFYKVVDLPVSGYSFPSPPSFPVPVPETEQYCNFFGPLRMHAYCAEARPTDPDFTQNRGRVHLFAVLNGQAGRDPYSDPRNIKEGNNRDIGYMNWFLDSASYRIEPRTNTLTGEAMQPQTGTTNGSLTSYEIGFEQRMNLWKSESLYQFTAKYTNTFNRDQFKQKLRSQVPQRGEYDVLFYYHNHYDRSTGHDGWESNVFDGNGKIKMFPEDNIPFHAFFAWSTSSLIVQPIAIHNDLTYAGFMNLFGQRHLITNWSASSTHISNFLDLSPKSW